MVSAQPGLHLQVLMQLSFSKNVLFQDTGTIKYQLDNNDKNQDTKILEKR